MARLLLIVLVLVPACTNELVSNRTDAGAAIDAAVMDAWIAPHDAGHDALGNADTLPPLDYGPTGTDDAAIMNAPLPRGFGCTASTTTIVTVQNTGTTTWSADLGYFFGPDDVADPLARSGGSLDGAIVAPGDTHDFAIVLGASGASPGAHTTSWRMHHGTAFGAAASGDITVYACESNDPASFDLAAVQIIASPDVRGFSRTSMLISIAFHPSAQSWHIDHTLRGTWPPIVIDATNGTTQEATIWIFFHIGGTWYATGGERLRPNQTDKGIPNPSQLGPDWLYSSAWGVMAGYVPSPGDLVGFMVAAGSTRADDQVIVMERTNVVLIPFPADDVDSSFPPFAWTE